MTDANQTPPRPADAYFTSEQFEAMKAAELGYLGIDAGREKLFGLALSGGGIRSASFALGVLQALHGFGAFNRFQFLSTVSGGGYIGSALTYFRNVFTFPDPADPTEILNWFPFGYLTRNSRLRAIGARTAKPTDAPSLRAFEIVSFLRQHASFLTPSRKLDRPALAAGTLRGLVSSVLPYMTILVGIFGTLLAGGIFDRHLTTGGVEAALALDALTDQRTPPPYLALIPAALAGLLLAISLASSLWHVICSSLASRGKEDENKALRRYLTALDCMSLVGGLLLLAGALLLLALMPWLHDYLGSLLSAGGEMPATLAALFAAIGGAAAQIAKLRAIVGGEKTAPSPLRTIGMALAGIAFVFGVLLLAYIIGFHLANAALDRWAPAIGSRVPVPVTLLGVLIPLFVGLLGLGLAVLVNVNHASQHRLYRDRLMEVFCAEQKALTGGQWCAADLAQKSTGWLMNMTKMKRPHHLISTTLITSDSNTRRYRGRGGDNFVLSPLYCGSDATGWARTSVAMPALSIATAAAVSGAALNAHAGPHGSGGLRNKAYAALLSFLGLNLGYWARNPLKFADPAKTPNFQMPNLISPGWRNISGRGLHENATYVQLSDGGHFENLALYELIRRKVDFLWVSDAGQDTKFSFEDLSSAIERVRVDFGVNIRFYDEEYDLTHLLPGSAQTDTPASKNFAEEYHLAKRGYAIGTIEYADGSRGVIVYIKSTLTRFLPGDIYGYKARNDDFPHQTTLDQFFDEEQFEAYRELGYRLAAQLFRDIDAARKAAARVDGSTGSDALDKVALALGV